MTFQIWIATLNSATSSPLRKSSTSAALPSVSILLSLPSHSRFVSSKPSSASPPLPAPREPSNSPAPKKSSSNAPAAPSITSRKTSTDARCIGRGEVGFLRVGFIGSAMLTPLPQMLGTYRRQFPKVHIQLHESFTASVVHSLLNGFLDAGCLRDGGPSPASAQGEARALVFRPLLLASPQKQLLHIQPVLHPLIPLHIHIVR